MTDTFPPLSRLGQPYLIQNLVQGIIAMSHSEFCPGKTALYHYKSFTGYNRLVKDKGLELVHGGSVIKGATLSN